MTTLDTSGHIDIRPRPGYTATVRWRWEDLSPFAQGYVEALFAEQRQWNGRPVLPAPAPEGSSPSQVVEIGFSDLAPEALAMILRDCADMVEPSRFTFENSREAGAFCWQMRQEAWGAMSGRAGLRERFPRLRVYLNDTGKVMLEIAR